MEAEYWHNAWTEDRIGFHQPDVNKRLQKWWPALEHPPGTPVLVPLCGKSIDMLWLHQRGYPVLGVELSSKASRAFFTENELPFDLAQQGDFEVFTGTGSATGLQVLAGDFFALTPSHTRQCVGFYDRASLIAMNPAMQSEYALQLGRILPAGSRGLLLSISFDQNKMKGPPFSVPDETLRKLLDDGFEISQFAHYSGPECLGNLAARGLDTLDERAYLLKRKKSA